MNNKKKTLVILTPGFPMSEDDSTCLPLQQQLILSLKKLEPLLNIIVLSFQYPYHVKTYQWHDITVMSFNGRNKGGLKKLLLRNKINATLKKIHDETEIIGLLSFWYNECAWVGKKFGEKYDIKHYCWLLGQDARKENKYPGRLKPKPNELIALSDFIQDEFEKNHGTRPFTVIPPGIEPNTHRPIIEKDIDLLATGSLIPLKRFGIFIEIVAEIKKTFPNINAMLIGDGPEKEKLQTLVLKLGLEKNIILTGELPYDKVQDMMERSKVFLHPSSYEGFGAVCLEAISKGAKVISFVKPMKKEIRNWYIVRTEKEMVKKTIELLQDRNIFYEKVIPFELNEVTRKMLELFK